MFTHLHPDKSSSCAPSAADLNLEWKMNVFMQQMLVHRTESHRFILLIKPNRTESFQTKFQIKTYCSCITSEPMYLDTYRIVLKGKDVHP